MFNTVILTGRLTSDAELKTTPNGVFVTSFTIANETGYGENKKINFIPIVAWRQTAEFVAKYFGKGKAIGIEGSIQVRKYTDKDGNNRTAFEVVANNVQFIERKTGEDQNEETTYGIDESNFTQLADDDDLPF